MILCLDVGNTLIHGGVFVHHNQQLQFRLHTTKHASSDELGVFLRNVLRENGIDHRSIEHIALCTVVPTLLHALRNCCLKYFDIEPFILQAGVRTGLKIKYRNPVEVGSDRIANAIAAVTLFPGENLIIADLGTATTLCAVTAQKEYLGGVIMAGLKISAEALESRTAQLPSVAIVEPQRVVGRSTVECIQSGLYFGTLGMLKELISGMHQECFPGASYRVIGTSGFSSLFEDAGIFHEVIPDLVLKGLRIAWDLNQPGRIHSPAVAPAASPPR